VIIELYADNNGDGNADGLALASASTDINGNYSFSSVEPGSWVLFQIQPENYDDVSDYDITPDPDGDDFSQGPDNDIPVVLDPAENDSGNNFVESPMPGIICGVVTDELGNQLSGIIIELYADLNGDGVADGDPLSNVTVDGETGTYCFEDVVIGNYVLEEIQPDNYENFSDYDHSPDPDGDDSDQGPDNNIPVTVTPGEADLDNNFIDILCPDPPQIMGDATYYICDGESVTFTAVDQEVEGAIYTWSFGEGAQTQNATGVGPHVIAYDWTAGNQIDGASVVLQVEKPGCPTQSLEIAVVFVSPIADATIDAETTDACAYLSRTFQPVAPIIPGAIYTWDFGDGSIPSTASGYGPHDVLYVTTGVKTVELIVNPNYPVLKNCPDTSNISFNVVTCVGNIGGNVLGDLGTPLENVLITLFLDEDGNGQADDLNAPLELTFTNVLGQFSFTNLSIANYVIIETQPENYYSVFDMDLSPDGDEAQNLNILDDIIPVSVSPLEDDIDNIFQETSKAGSISGAVYVDGNGDQGLNVGEGISDVTVKLFNDNNQDGVADSTVPVDSVITNEVGIFVFINVYEGDYVIEETQPLAFDNFMDQDVTDDGDHVTNTNQTDDIIPVTITPNEADADNQFRELNPVSPIGTVAENAQTQYTVEGDTLSLPGKEIPGTENHRGDPCSGIVTNTLNDGPGSFRNAISCNADTIIFSPTLTDKRIYISTDKLLINRNVVIKSSLTSNIQVISLIDDGIEIAPGSKVEFVEMCIMGSSGTNLAIKNAGELTLDSSVICHNPLVPGEKELIVNQGVLIIRGNTKIGAKK
jgi:hypothetical protein